MRIASAALAGAGYHSSVGESVIHGCASAIVWAGVSNSFCPDVKTIRATVVPYRFFASAVSVNALAIALANVASESSGGRSREESF